MYMTYIRPIIQYEYNRVGIHWLESQKLQKNQMKLKESSKVLNITFKTYSF